MRLRTVKLEIEQHMTFECTRLREFIMSLLLSTDGAYSPPCTDEEELLVGIEDLPEGADIAPCSDAEHEPLPTPIDDQQGLVTVVPVPVVDVPIPVPVPKAEGRVCTMRRYSVQLRRPAPTTRTPYTRGRGKTMKK
ncbi:Hypothetical predicted protein [Olea europaea subsp. europaea]|uniref:Uncharacterized protein n=1 Tax=Olea europaea subsp. europaea TaxID=158383 RepID=A0A8S0QX84_OLEEU|nr:Hypothetical predicted protein [Olea europaea subsp. europaea]